MRRQRSPSRVSCRLAVKQQTLGAGWSAYRSNLGTPSRSTHGTNHSECRQRSHGYLRQRVCAHSYGTKTLIQNRWQLRSDESATKTLADPSAGRRDMRSEVEAGVRTINEHRNEQIRCQTRIGLAVGHPKYPREFTLCRFHHVGICGTGERCTAGRVVYGRGVE